MRTALFADVHSNIDALQACLRHARQQGADRLAFLGDLVGYGPDPAAVVDLVAALHHDGAVVVKGNHDEAIEVEPKSRDINDAAYDVVTWTRAALSAAQRRFLASLPLLVKDRDSDACFVHGSAHRPEKWEYVHDAPAAQRSMDAAGTSYIFGGHVHDQALYFRTPTGKTSSFQPTSGSPVPTARRRGWLAIAGSVGQPRDGNPAAAYALFDAASESMTFFRIPYDHAATAARMRAARLPELLIQRLLGGG